MLIVGVGMDSGHQSALDPELFVEDFRYRREAVCGAGGIRHDLM